MQIKEALKMAAGAFLSFAVAVSSADAADGKYAVWDGSGYRWVDSIVDAQVAEFKTRLDRLLPLQDGDRSSVTKVSSHGRILELHLRVNVQPTDWLKSWQIRLCKDNFVRKRILALGGGVVIDGYDASGNSLGTGAVTLKACFPLAEDEPSPQDPRFNYYRSAQAPSVQQLYPVCNSPSESQKKACDYFAKHIAILEGKLHSLCADAGESITKTADNVTGIYVNIAEKSEFTYLHEDDRIWDSYIAPMLGKNYTVWEMNMRWKDNLIESKSYLVAANPTVNHRADIISKEIKSPASEYGMTWKPLTSADDQRDGLFGDDLIIFRVKTGEVMAKRRVYFYVLRDGLAMLTGADPLGPRIIYPPQPRHATFIRACPNYSPPSADAYIDRRPRTSYEFVSRVLHPKVMPAENAINTYALARGVGERVDSCMAMSFGPTIGPEDISPKVVGNDLVFELKNTQDSLTCRNFFDIHFIDMAVERRVRFYDGQVWKFEDVMVRALPSASVR